MSRLIEPKICRMCGQDLPPGGTRRIGICVWCVLKQKEGENLTRIPEPKYGRPKSTDTNI